MIVISTFLMYMELQIEQLTTLSIVKELFTKSYHRQMLGIRRVEEAMNMSSIGSRIFLKVTKSPILLCHYILRKIPNYSSKSVVGITKLCYSFRSCVV